MATRTLVASSAILLGGGEGHAQVPRESGPGPKPQGSGSALLKEEVDLFGLFLVVPRHRPASRQFGTRVEARHPG